MKTNKAKTKLSLSKIKRLKDQVMLNPMLKYPRNLDCYCGSNEKFKACCLPKQAKQIPIELGLKLKEYLKYIKAMHAKN